MHSEGTGRHLMARKQAAIQLQSLLLMMTGEAVLGICFDVYESTVRAGLSLQSRFYWPAALNVTMVSFGRSAALAMTTQLLPSAYHAVLCTPFSCNWRFFCIHVCRA
jgi:hypothetical protein